MSASICTNPERLRRRRQITTEAAGGADQRDPRLGALIVVSSAVVFYGAIAAFIWHFL